MNVMLDFICTGFAEQRGTGSKGKKIKMKIKQGIVQWVHRAGFNIKKYGGGIYDVMSALNIMKSSSMFSIKFTATSPSVPDNNKWPKGPHIVHLSTMCHICCHILVF